ncbi:MAG: phage minor head protein [Methylococcaceae bacterium]
MPEPIKLSFNQPFYRAVEEMKKRGAVLPDKYYSEIQGLHRQLNFSIAGKASLDQLQAVLDSLEDALSKGSTFAKWQKDIRVQDLRLPKHRLDNIFRTNIQAAYNRGHWENFIEHKSTRPYLMYDAINDSRVRPTHLVMDGIIRPVGDSFWATNYPPNGFRCRCRCISLNERQARERSKNGNGLSKVVDDTMKPDKGFDYNVGTDLTAGIEKAKADVMTSNRVNQVLKSTLQRYEENKAMTIYQNTLTEVKEAIQSKSFSDFYHNNDAIGSFVVGALSESDMAILGTESAVVLMSKESLETHKISHPDITIEHYKQLPEIIEKGEVYPTQKRRYVLLKVEDKTYRAALKVTQDGSEVYILSLIYQPDEKAEKEIRKKFNRVR